MSKPSRADLVRVASRRYGLTALRFAKLGYSVIPGDGGKDGKAPAIKWAQYSSGRNPAPRESLEIERIVALSDDRPGCLRGLLILDSHVDPKRRLTVVDI